MTDNNTINNNNIILEEETQLHLETKNIITELNTTESTTTESKPIIINDCNINDKCCNNILELNKNICIVDLSYMTFTRFFAVRRWYEIKYSKDKPDWKIPDTHNWLEDKEFMEKFDKLFFEKLFKLCASRHIPKHNIIFVIDCRHKDNWRVIKKDDYKGTRKDSHEKNKFYSFDIFPYVRNILIKELQEESRNIVFKQPNLEADDVIACLVKYLRTSKQYTQNITIITTDKDYFQLCNDKTQCFDLSGKNVSTPVISNFTNSQEYLLYKILLGDPSDNIPPCYFTKSFLTTANINTKKPKLKATNTTITKVFTDISSKKLLLDYLEYVRDLKTMTEDELKAKWLHKYDVFEVITENKQFESNARMIDFDNIPLEYVNKVNNLFTEVL